MSKKVDMRVDKKLIFIDDNTVVCLTYAHGNSKITMGGSLRLRDLIWRLYVGSFKECDGEPEFYSVTRTKCRLSFKASWAQYQKAIENMETNLDYEVQDTDNIDRKM